MSETTYTTIKLPVEFVKDIIDPIVDDPKSGFGSRAEFIKQAVREYHQKKMATV